MARTDARPAERAAYVPPTWPLNLAIVLALGFAFSGLNAIFTEPSWWFVVAGFIGAVTFGVAAVRAFTRWTGWPALAGVVVLLVCLTFSFASGQSLIGFIPTADAFVRFAELIGEGFGSISNQGVPADATTGIVFLLAAGAGILTIVTDAIAITAKRPALVGIPLVALLAVPSIFDRSQADPWVFILTAGAYLLLLYLSIGEARTGGALGVAASALAVALVLPLVAPPSAPEIEDASNGTGFTIGINTFIALGDNLRRPNPSRVLEYSTSVEHGQYLTVSSIDNFTGSQWKPAAPGANTEVGLLDIGPVPGQDDEIEVEAATTTIDILNMGGRFAPAPYAPSRIIGLSEDWTFDPDNLTITSTGDSARGAQYEVRSELAQPTVQELRAAGPVPEDFDLYLAMPDGLAPSVAETAQSVVEEAEATTAFDQAVALQSYFTDGSFEYSEQAPVEQGYDGTSAEVVGRFLEAKSGYCVHFSSAMAVMARSLGIPARIAVGFTPGEYVVGDNDDDEPAYYVVTTANLHAWPELYFDGVGWVRFEPTVGRGDIPSFVDEDRDPTNPSSSPSPSASNSTAARPTASASASPSASAAPDTSNDFGSILVAGITVGALGIGAIVVLLLPLLPALVRVVRRARRYWRVWRRQSAGEAWSELSDTAIDLGWKATATTPREFEDLVRPGMPDKATAALERLRAAIEFTAYSRSPEPARIVDVRVVRRAMHAASSRNDRIRARLNPRSVVLRGWRRR